jgi:murein DD-endopeptidase MepM/ murein hydrolase activator NlpD
MGNSQYALYAHLKPYSVTLQVGDVVTEGQKLGLLGNTGNTTGPHLHFQVMDRPSALKTNGLPFVFDCFVLSSAVMDSIDGTGNNFSAGTPLPLQPIGTFERDRLPLALDIIDIP